MTARATFLAMAFAALASVPVQAQQTGTVLVTVTNKMTQRPLSGAQVSLPDLRNVGGITDANGRLSLPNIPAGTHTVLVTFLGFNEERRTGVTVAAGQTANLTFAMDEAVLSLQQITVSGSVDPTKGVMRPFTVSTVGAEQLQVPTTNSALAAIQGKVAGASVIRGSGKPGDGVQIMLRSATSFEGSNSPMIVVDGVVISRELNSTTADIEALDIESIEIIKGAAAASLYGSRAASGVVSITTNRGRSLPMNSTRVTSRTEFGKSFLGNSIPLTTAHHYLMNADKTGLINSSGRDTTWAGRTVEPSATNCPLNSPAEACVSSRRIADRAYPGQVYDNIAALYNPGQFLSNNVTVSNNGENTTFMVSLTRFDEAGTLEGNDGFWRNVGRFSIDHRMGTKFSVSFIGQHTKTREDEVSGNPYTSVLTYPVYVDLSAKGPDGKFLMAPDSTVELENPLWRQTTRDNYTGRSRTLGSLSARYNPVNWVTFDGQLSYDRADTKQQEYVPKGVPTSITSDQPALGSLYLEHQENNTVNAAFGATFTRQMGDLNLRLATRGTMEKETMENFSAFGEEFLTKGVRDLSNARVVSNVTSGTTDIRANGFYADLSLDFKDRYIGSFLVRRDGSSLFGPNNKWHTYRRASAAYRISQEEWFNVPHIDELKFRYAMGEAGGRPGYTSQYEQWNVSRTGGLTRENAGNPSLKPSFTREQEWGIDAIGMNNRLQLELVYARQMSKDQIIIIPASVMTGFSSMQANAAKLIGQTYEATLTAYPIRRQNLTWSINAIADHSSNELVEWERACFWGSNAGREHEFTCAGESAGDFWVQQTIRRKEDLPSWAAARADEFDVNDEGYLVWVGKNPTTGQPNRWTQGLTLQPGECEGASGGACGWGSLTTINGYTYRWGEPFRIVDEEGNFVRKNMGSSLPDVGFGFGTNIRYKGTSLFAQFRGQIGGKIHSDSRQWLYNQLRHGDLDQSGKPDSLKKTIDYYQRALAVGFSGYHDTFLEDATHLKLGELSIRQRISRNTLRRVLGNAAPAEIGIGVNGRNLFTLTNYRGFDPEAGSQLSRVEGIGYPHTRVWTATLDITF